MAMMLMEPMKMRMLTEGETLALITLLMRGGLALIASMLTAVVVRHAAHAGSGFDSSRPDLRTGGTDNYEDGSKRTLMSRQVPSSCRPPPPSPLTKNAPDGRIAEHSIKILLLSSHAK